MAIRLSASRRRGRRAGGAASIAPTANSECMNLHLHEISTQVTSGLDRSAALR
jgi:hypothetical protein